MTNAAPARGYAEESEPRCIRCRLYRSEHHEFEAPIIPAGCGCDPTEWMNQCAIPRICPTFTADPNPVFGDTCRDCQHEEPCHKEDGK